MRTECFEIKEYEEIIIELKIMLDKLSDDLIGHEVSWI
jgi:hypothetical protein